MRGVARKSVLAFVEGMKADTVSSLRTCPVSERERRELYVDTIKRLSLIVEELQSDAQILPKTLQFLQHLEQSFEMTNDPHWSARHYLNEELGEVSTIEAVRKIRDGLITELRDELTA